MHLRRSFLAWRRLAYAGGLAAVLMAYGAFDRAEAQQQTAATPPPEPAAGEDFNDPFENVNRSIFDVNNQIDKIVLVPVASAYRTVLPEPIRDGVHNFLRNLDEPIVFANDVLQGRPDLAGNTLGRIVTNSTLGIGGLFDVAGQAGLRYHSNDLGITFAVWGIGSGPYLMLPLLGPSNIRDGLGQAGDSYADPGNLVAVNNGFLWATFARGAAQGVDFRSRNIETLADIERTSLDYYATIRSLYNQRRAAEIRHEDSNVPNVSPLGGSDDSPGPPMQYRVAPASPATGASRQ